MSNKEREISIYQTPLWSKEIKHLRDKTNTKTHLITEMILKTSIINHKESTDDQQTTQSNLK